MPTKPVAEPPKRTERDIIVATLRHNAARYLTASQQHDENSHHHIYCKNYAGCMTLLAEYFESGRHITDPAHIIPPL